jgi:hypothetical protein
MKLSSDGGDSGSKECKRDFCGLRLAGVWSQGVGFVLVGLARIWLSRRKDVFTFNLLCKGILYILYFECDL